MKKQQQKTETMRFISTFTACIITSVVVVAAASVVLAQTANDNGNANTNVNTNVALNLNTNTSPSPTLDSTISNSTDPQIIELNQKILDKQNQIEEMKRQTAIYERQLQDKQSQSITLQNELLDIGDSISNTENDLEITKAQIESLQLQIQRVERQIVAKEKEITSQKDELAGLLRDVYASDQVSNLEIIVQEQTFSAFFSRVQSIHALSSSVKDTLQEVIEAKKQLDEAKNDLTTKRQKIDETRVELERSQELLAQQQSYKQGLLDQTQDSESKFQQVLQELRTESSNADSEIQTLIQQVNDRLTASGVDLLQGTAAQLSWPADVSRGISAYYHDPTYPFRKIMEHSAVDIRLPHGSTVVAAADGVVAIARKLDWIRDSKGKILYPAYNYVTIVHGGNIATVYGHLSVVSVTEGQTVKRGDVIGKSGATPGTAGAGRLTTGPHLHFEVRLNGIPEDPMKYLPVL